MELKGEYHIASPREKVWEMLNDPDVLRACLPGCESLEPEGDGFRAKVTTRIGPVKATFNGSVSLSNMNPPESYTIAGEGKGGVAGFASGSADVSLAEEAEGTLLNYTADAKVGGKLAQLGSRLIESTARKLADQFFAKFAEMADSGALEGGEGEAKAPPSKAGAAVEPAEAEPAAPTAEKHEGLVAHAAHEVAEVAHEVVHEVAEVAHHAEEELEKQAASGLFGGPWMWGVLVVAAILLLLLLLSGGGG